jgi:phage gp36-like protein
MNDLLAYIDQVNLFQMVNDWAEAGNNTSLQTNAINAVCQIASNKVDALLSSIYVVPFQVPIPAKVYTASVIFAVEMLWARRLTPEEKNPMKAEADYWRETLIKINNGDIPLDYESSRAFQPIIVKKHCSRVDTNIF